MKDFETNNNNKNRRLRSHDRLTRLLRTIILFIFLIVAAILMNVLIQSRLEPKAHIEDWQIIRYYDELLNILDEEPEYDIGETGKKYEELFLFEDDSECGEGWNHRSARYDEKVGTYGGNARISVLTDNENIARVRVRHTMCLPQEAEGEFCRSRQEKEFVIDAVYTIAKNSKRIDCRAEICNNVRDHRLRVVFPTHSEAAEFYTAMPYGLQKWTEDKEDHSYDFEPYSPVVPGHGCLMMEDGKDMFSVYSKGLYEFEVAKRKDRAISLTLFRAIPKETFMLKSDMGQLQRKMRFEFAVDLERRPMAEALRRSKAYQLGLLTCPAAGAGRELPKECSIVSVTGNAVFSSLRARGLLSGKPELRLYDAAGGSKGEVSFYKTLKKAVRVRMDGTVLGEAEVCGGKLQYELSDHEIGSWILEF